MPPPRSCWRSGSGGRPCGQQVAGGSWLCGDNCVWLGAVFLVTPPAFSRNLLANPFNCNCQLAWLGDWLRKRKIVTGNPRCQNPDFLRQIPLQDVASPDFRCEEGNTWAPPGGWGDRAWSRPREEGSPGEGRSEEHGHSGSPAPASAWWGLRWACCFKKWGNTDKGRA